ncbi:hypothetical protein [Endozoicomonas sp. 8E]|uniref:hypothetical protein n=1 Tax=Endozoicomonas sp. 8E TaxID=3035692 RepID=UPI002938F951|nr:hypothetical protein [Endozoicomonas sp. 8E]WOG27097.1 hypothetical protein P6910_21480 [Endozoicomonas sp. 8E]
MLLLLLRSVFCPAEPWTERFSVKLEQNSDSPEQSFYKCDCRTLPGSLSGTDCNTTCKGSCSLPDNERHMTFSFEIKSTILDSVSWQWLHAPHLLVSYELILTTRDTPMSSTPYLCLTVEVVITIGWLLKSYWNPDSPFFNPIEQQRASILTFEDHPFAIITSALDSGENSAQYQLSESSGQQTREKLTFTKGYFSKLLYSDSGNGDEGPEQHQHTLNLNCYVYPCNGVCRFRPSLFDSRELSEQPLHSKESSYPHQANGHCLDCIDLFKPESAEDSLEEPLLKILNDLSDIQPLFTSDPLFDGNSMDGAALNGIASITNAAGPFNDELPMPGYWPPTADHLIDINGSIDLYDLLREAGFSSTPDYSEIPRSTNESSQPDNGQPHLSPVGATNATNDRRQPKCDLTTVGKDGQLRPCGAIFKNAKSLAVHRSSYHTGQKTCNEMLVGKDGQSRPCGVVFKNAQALSKHKRRDHTGQQSCDMSVFGKDGQLLLCGKVCNNAIALMDHKRRAHIKEYTCQATAVVKSGQSQPCGKVCKSVEAMSVHKIRYHSGQQTCDVTVAGEDGLQPCGKVFSNIINLLNHNRRDHCEQQICNLTVVGKDGRQQPCGKVCKNTRALSSHRSKYHRGQKTCEVTVIGEDGQPGPCGKVCNSPQALTNHKRTHRKRKPVDADQKAE